MTLHRKIRFGIPKGNLNKPDDNKGYTKLLFEKAGYHISGYDPGKETLNPVVKELEEFFEFFCMKPKQFTELSNMGDLDLVILGADSMEEWYSKIWQRTKWSEKIDDELSFLEGGKSERPWLYASEFLTDEILEKGQLHKPGFYDLNPRVDLFRKFKKGFLKFEPLLDLKFGRVDICWGVTENHSKKIKEIRDHIAYEEVIRRGHLIKIGSAYPNLTHEAVSQFVNVNFMRLMDGPDFDKNYTRLNIYNFPSNTEVMPKLGIDYLVDCISTGKSFKDNRLITIGEPILKNSTACIYKGHLSVLDLEKNEQGELCNPIFLEMMQRLKTASLEYGKERRDSCYYQAP